MHSIARAALLMVAAVSLACSGGGSSLPAPNPERLPFADKLNVDFAKMTKTKLGVYVRDLELGTGPLVQAGQNLSVRYSGSLNNGTEFDKVGPGEKPITFKLGRRQVIQGWDDGIVGMRVGGRRQLVIPPDLGYGQERSGKIPGDATLVFVIEIIGAKY
jgi:FKBP-type peptidyl-prolyl cis-trans isomerase FkpA